MVLPRLLSFLPWLPVLLLSLMTAQAPASADGPAHALPYAESRQWSHFPLPLSHYADHAEPSALQKILQRAKASPFNVTATLIFLLAVAHTFIAGGFRKLAHFEEAKHRRRIRKEGRTGEAKPHEDAEDDVSLKATVYHFLGEIEAIFGIWVVALIAAGIAFYSWDDVVSYIGHDVNYTEPLFVVVIMAIAASRPVLQFAESCLGRVAGMLGGTVGAWWLSVLIIAPILGSLITEPAAMTIAALILRRRIYPLGPNEKFAYGTLGLLFVNISIGGTLTNFAAPPILMVANTWDWSSLTVLGNLGWKCGISILLGTLAYYFLFRQELARLEKIAHPEPEGTTPLWAERDDPIPLWVTLFHLSTLFWTVFTNHYPALFIGGFLFFLAFVEGTRHHQNPILLRPPILVGFFLAALVIHGGCQSWWIGPLLATEIPSPALLLGAAGLTAFNDNAAITFLASQASDLSDLTKYAIVAGAVAGGGLTVIANAPNPAGQSILYKHFKGGISPFKLLAGAALPTVIAIILLIVLKSPLMHA